jgi:hypothetical protein
VSRGPTLLAGLAVCLLLLALLPSCGQRRVADEPASWQLTPGALNPDVTQATIRSTICRAGWTKTVRPPSGYTDELKLAQMRAYGRRGTAHDYQEDHLISLELGGHPTDPRNLWPEPYPRAADVDRIENDLNAQVCSGRLSLADAQRRESALKHSQG